MHMIIKGGLVALVGVAFFTLLACTVPRNDGFNWGHQAVIYNEGQRK